MFALRVFIFLLAASFIKCTDYSCSSLPGLCLKPDDTHIPIIEELSNRIEKDRSWKNNVKIMDKNFLEDTAEYLQLQKIRDHKNLPLQAAFKGYIDIIQFLLRNKLPINRTYGPYRFTMLHAAAANGHYALAYLLIQHGANIHVRNIVGNTALHKAAEHGHLKVVKLLVDLGADIDSQNYKGRTPLFSSIEHESVVQYLVENGCQTEIEDDDGNIIYDLRNEYSDNSNDQSGDKKKSKGSVGKWERRGQKFDELVKKFIPS